MAKSLCGSCRGSEFNSQNPQGGSQLAITPVPGDPMWSSDFTAWVVGFELSIYVLVQGMGSVVHRVPVIEVLKRRGRSWLALLGSRSVPQESPFLLWLDLLYSGLICSSPEPWGSS